MKRKEILSRILGITMFVLVGSTIVPKLIYGDVLKDSAVNDVKNYAIVNETDEKISDTASENGKDTDTIRKTENVQTEKLQINKKTEESDKSLNAEAASEAEEPDAGSAEQDVSNKTEVNYIESIEKNIINGDLLQESSLKIAVLSDIHYFSSSMIKNCADFIKDKNSDRKLLEESSAILDSALEAVKEDKPDVLLITGDLTKDGEKKCHEEVAAKLRNLKKELKAEGTDIKIYLINGNHDVNNSNAKDFSSGEGIAAEKTTAEDFREIYKDITYDNVDEVFTPSKGEQGGLSYCVSPKNGFTVIAIDSAKYSSDATDSGLDEHETSGAISQELQDWVVSKVKEAKVKGNTVLALEHHGIVPHFDTEPSILSEYLVKDYDAIGKKFADAGIKYMFTGHMHSNDISKLTTDSENNLYDIETGSIVTYPCPIRTINLLRKYENNDLKETMDIKTNNIKSIDYTDLETGDKVDDLTSYSKKNCMKSVVITTAAEEYADKFIGEMESNGGIKKYMDSLLKKDTGDYIVEKISENIPHSEDNAVDIKGIFKMYFDNNHKRIVFRGKGLLKDESLYITEESIKKEIVENLLSQVDSKILSNTDYVNTIIDNTINRILDMNVHKGENSDESKTVYDLINYVYLANIAGDENSTAWVEEAAENFKNTILINSLKDIIVDQCNTIVNDNEDNLTFDGDKIITRGSGIFSGMLKRAVVKALGNNVGQAIKTFNIDTKEKLNDFSNKIFTSDVKENLGQLVYDVVMSMTNDTNYTEDNNTFIYS